MRFIKNLSIAALALTLLAGCSEGGMLNLRPAPISNLTKAAPGSEFVSSSGQFETSLSRNYKVMQSTGTFNSKMVQGSTPSGYKLYYSVQGSVISEEL